MNDIVDFTGFTEGEVLAALYNNAQPLGMGMLHFNSKPMTEEEANKILSSHHGGYFDYLNGRCMKVLMDTFPRINSRLYDRDSKKPMQRVLEELEYKRSKNNSSSDDKNSKNPIIRVLDKAEDTRSEDNPSSGDQ